MGRAEQRDDLTLLPLRGGATLVVAVDSLGAIGPKELDRVKVPGYVVGRFSCRVPLMEVLAVGAEPLLVVNALCVEPEPTGADILAGIRDEAAVAGLDPETMVTGSTEKNIPTAQTALGVTVIALAPTQPGGQVVLRWGRCAAGDAVIAVGRPKVGNEVRLDDVDIADIPTMVAILRFPGAGDVLPVGSGGIRAEARKLARRGGLDFSLEPGCGLDLEASAGPSTCILVSVPAPLEDAFGRHISTTNRPWARVGRLYTPGGEA